jgi:hypothetical protein
MAIPFAHKYDYPSNEIRGELADSLRGAKLVIGIIFHQAWYSKRTTMIFLNISSFSIFFFSSVSIEKN